MVEGECRASGAVLEGITGCRRMWTASGRPPPAESPHLYGRDSWRQVQDQLTEHMAARTGALDWLEVWRELKLSARVQVLVSAAVIVSDWIARSDLLPFHHGQLPSVMDVTERAASALSRLDLPMPWRPGLGQEDLGMLFAARFQDERIVREAL